MSLLCVGDALVSQWWAAMLRWCFGDGIVMLTRWWILMNIFSFSVGSEAKRVAVRCVFAIGVVCWANFASIIDRSWWVNRALCIAFGRSAMSKCSLASPSKLLPKTHGLPGIQWQLGRWYATRPGWMPRFRDGTISLPLWWSPSIYNKSMMYPDVSCVSGADGLWRRCPIQWWLASWCTTWLWIL